MTPEEQAKKILNRMTVDFNIDKFQTKECSLVAVELIIGSINENDFEKMNYWQKVKNEIKKIN